MDSEPRTYNGRNAGLLVVAVTVVVFVALNLLGRATRPKPPVAPPTPTVVSVSPSR